MNVVNAGVETDYYAYTKPDGRTDVETVETILSDQIEQPANLIIEQLRNGNYILSETDRMTLAIYMVATIRRVPKHRERVQELMPKFIQETLQSLPERLAAWEKHLGKDLSNHVSKIEETIAGLGESPPDLFYLPEVSLGLASAIATMHWYFLRPAKGYKLLTADNPVIFTEAKGLQPPAGKLSFPLSQDLLLEATWTQINKPVSFKVDAALIQNINKLLIGGSVRYIYACCNANWVTKLIQENLSN